MALNTDKKTQIQYRTSTNRLELYKQGFNYVEDDSTDAKSAPVPSNAELIGKADIIERSSVPESHRKAADSLMIIKKIFGHPVVQSKLSEEEFLLIRKYCFKLLERTTANEAKEEFRLLRDLCNSRDDYQRIEAEKLVEIRLKELKYLIATNFVTVKNAEFNGHKFIEKYFESISKYGN